MALSTILRRSASSVTPIAARLLVGQRKFSHQCGSLSIVVNHARKFISDDSFLALYNSRFSYSTSSAVAHPSSDDSLLRVIESELNCAEESLEAVEGAHECFPFQVNDNPGQQTVSLTREYQGETILIDVEPSGLITGEDNDSDSDVDKDSQSSLPMVVNVSKPGAPSLVFGLTAYAKEIVIDNLIVKDPALTEDQVPFEGPRFDELDESMQKAFHKFLETRE